MQLRRYFEGLAATLPADGPGFSAAVLRDGEVAFELHYGLASLELGVPLSADSMYYMASESKQFTAAAVMLLVRAGAIGLDDDVCRHLPELAEFEQAFPLRSLLNHSSGIPDYFQFLRCQPGRHEADYFNNADILKVIARMDRVLFTTGEKHGYSNSNYILLAALVERLSGMSLGRYVRAQLLAPLGIARMGFDEDRQTVLPGRVFSYEADAGGTRPGGYKQHLGNANTVGDGGLYASVRELLLWERAWHAQWAQPDSLLHAMLQPSPLNDGMAPSYRFGLEWLQRQGQEVVFHSGCLWGFNTLLLRLPQQQLSVIHLSNSERAAPDWEQALAAALA
ncbi:CubicO group peptidase, beta-lactamase class C family [Duganella sacchari]|uniref:CubicO group peptidase, beta-lactamase class C family n=1 Tax=Duganella sacchari TaxID=551987 RepID=A0A1M7Q900_9BURK|nr:serine hydrolase domain-containing protein [Duganella sacchari]SHN27050.1 CubicO group peptidase, beta-lactamase class C family [Duganella sacchari]